MAYSRRILVLATGIGGGNWPPLAAVTVGLHRTGHVVKCYGDAMIARDFAAGAAGVEVVPAEHNLRTFIVRWQEAGGLGPSPLRTWAEACAPSVRSFATDFQPQAIVSELFTVELARLTKTECGIPFCFINPGYYFGPGSRRPPEADFIGMSRVFREESMPAVRKASLVLHGTDPIFDPPPPGLPAHHYYVGALAWERSSDAPAYLDVPGPRWVLVTLSMSPQEGEMTLAGTALRTLAEFPVRTLLTLSERHPREDLGVVPPNARIELFVPHSAVLRRSCLLISHAGHGIVTKALSYGVPMVLVPWGRDQPGVAARAAALGIAEVIPRQDLTAARLSAAIRKVLGTARYQEEAAQIAGCMQGQDTVASACARIEEFMDKNSKKGGARVSKYSKD